MESEDKKPVEAQGVQAEQPQAQAQPQQQTITMGLDDFKQFVQSTVESVIKSSRTEQFREQAEEYNTKIGEAVQASQASLLRPNKVEGQSNLDYVNKVIEDDLRERRRNPEGKAYYSDKGEDFTKAKIIILKKMGLSNEEIAKVFEN